MRFLFCMGLAGISWAHSSLTFSKFFWLPQLLLLAHASSFSVVVTFSAPFTTFVLYLVLGSTRSVISLSVADGSISCRYLRRRSLLRATKPLSPFSLFLWRLVIFAIILDTCLALGSFSYGFRFYHFPFHNFCLSSSSILVRSFSLFCFRFSCCSLLLLFSESSLSSLTLYQIP